MSIADNGSADSIEPIDAVQYVKNHSERFLLNGIPTGWAIANAIAEDALVLGATDVRVLNEEGWWLVISNVDWLNVSCRCAATPRETFHRLLGFPEYAVNSHRHEILATAYAQAVVTISRVDRFVVSGDIPEDHHIWELLTNTRFERAVAFRLDCTPAVD